MESIRGSGQSLIGGIQCEAMTDDWDSIGASPNIPQAPGRICQTLSFQDATRQTLEYIRGRKDGTIKSLKCKYPKLNHAIMGGFEWGTILAIGALSGAGKSTFAKELRASFRDASLNSDIGYSGIVYLSFNFEMLARAQISREITSGKSIRMRELYSVDSPMSEETYEEIRQFVEAMDHGDSHFAENSEDAEVIARTILHFWETKCRDQNKALIYEIDHALLTKGRDGESEKERIDRLMYRLVEVKKEIASKGGGSFGIVLSQMNREIRKPERKMNPQLHLPSTSDLFGASSIEMCADYIYILHSPAKLQIASYTEVGFPVHFDDYECDPPSKKPMIYGLLVKNRTGESDILFPLKNRLEFFRLDEYPDEEFKQLLQ